MSDARHRFFLEAIDPNYGCTVLEAMFEVTDLADLRAILGPCADNDPELRGGYPLEIGDLANISRRFGVAFDPGGREVQLHRWDSLRVVPYLVHTNYELFLLLEGTKQLARELEVYPPHNHFQEDLFDRYVAQDLIHKEVFVKPFPTPLKLADGRVYEGEREVCYTRKGQEWRIPAWRLVRATFEKSRWNDDFERLEGMLYGYEEWQMDWWIAHIRERGAIVVPDTASASSIPSGPEQAVSRRVTDAS
jgi:hypothetical protein